MLRLEWEGQECTGRVYAMVRGKGGYGMRWGATMAHEEGVT